MDAADAQMRRCASICAAPRAWGYPIRLPIRRRRPRVPRAPLLGPPQASLPLLHRPSADHFGRRSGRARTGGGGGGGCGFLVAPFGAIGPLGRSDRRSRAVDITRKRHEDPHALSGHKETARGCMTRQLTAERRPSNCGTFGARAMPSVAAAVLPHVKWEACLLSIAQHFHVTQCFGGMSPCYFFCTLTLYLMLSHVLAVGGNL